MSYLQKYVRQVRPRNESYTPPVEKLQSFLTESATEESTKMENVIVACWNNRGLNAALFAKKIVEDQDVISWYNIPSKLAKGLDGKMLGGGNLTDKRVTDALYKFSHLLKKNLACL